MSREKKSDFKVTLVRNPNKTLNRTQSESDVPSKSSSSNKINITSSNKPNRTYPSDRGFNVPEMHSALKLSKKIDEVVKIGQTKSTSLQRLQSEAIVAERVLKNLNIPYNKPLFKNLISLEVNPKDYEVDYKARITPRPKVKAHQCIKVDDSSGSSTLEPSTPKVFLDVPKDVLGYVEETELYDPSSRLFKLYKVLKIDNCNANIVSLNGNSNLKSNDKVYLDLPKDILGFVEEKELYDPCSKSFKTYKVLKIDEAYSSETVTFDAKSAENRYRRIDGSDSNIGCDTVRSYKNVNYLPNESEFRFETVSTDSRECRISPPSYYRQFRE